MPKGNRNNCEIVYSVRMLIHRIEFRFFAVISKIQMFSVWKPDARKNRIRTVNIWRRFRYSVCDVRTMLYAWIVCQFLRLNTDDGFWIWWDWVNEPPRSWLGKYSRPIRKIVATRVLLKKIETRFFIIRPNSCTETNKPPPPASIVLDL